MTEEEFKQCIEQFQGALNVMYSHIQNCIDTHKSSAEMLNYCVKDELNDLQRTMGFMQIVVKSFAIDYAMMMTLYEEIKNTVDILERRYLPGND